MADYGFMNRQTTGGTTGTPRNYYEDDFEMPRWGAGSMLGEWAQSPTQQALQSHPMGEDVQRQNMGWAPRQGGQDGGAGYVAQNTFAPGGGATSGTGTTQPSPFLSWYTGNQANFGADNLNSITTAYNIYNQDREFGYNAGLNQQTLLQDAWRDAQQMGLANQQQSEAERVNRVSEQQFQQEQGLREQYYGLDEQRLNNEFATDNRGLDIQEQNVANQNQYNMGRLENELLSIQQTGRFQDGSLANQAQANQIAQEYNQGRLGNELLSIQQTGRFQDGSLANQARANEIANSYNQGRLRNEQVANEISRQQAETDRMYKSGMLSQQEAELRQRELQFNKNYALQQAQMAQQNSQFYADLASTQAWRETQAALEREGMDNAYRIALQQAIGRNQPQNVRWIG